MLKTRILLVGLALSLVSACVTVSWVEQLPPDVGVGRRYPSPVLETVKATRQAFVETNTQVKRIQQVNDSTWMLLGTQPESFFSYGEIVRVTITRGGLDSSDVRIYAAKKMGTNIFAEGMWPRTLYALITAQLGDSGVGLRAVNIPPTEKGGTTLN